MIENLFRYARTKFLIKLLTRDFHALSQSINYRVLLETLASLFIGHVPTLFLKP